MSLLGAISLILNGRLQNDLDAQGYKILNLDTSNLGEFENQIPFADSEALIKGSADATKLARFEIDGFTTATTRVFTLPNFNGTLVTADGAQSLTNKTSFNGMTLTGTGGGGISLDTSIISLSNSTLVLDGDVTLGGSGATLTLLYGINTTLTLPATGTVATTSQLPVISDTAYNEATWNGNLDGASKNAIRDKFESLVTAPFSDATALVKGSANNLKMFRIEVDGLSTGTRVMTPPDYDFTPASIAGVELIINKTVNGMTLNVGTAASTVAAPVYGMSPGTPSSLNLVAVSPQTSTTCVLRTTAPTDLILPVSGTLATVAGTIASASLSVNKDLGGSLSSDVKVSSQLAIKTYVDARTGSGIKDASDATVASATSVDLSVFDSTEDQIEVTGTTPIEAFVIDEGETKTLVFDDDVDLIQGSFLNLKGGRDMTAKAGSYAVVKGLAGGLVEMTFAKDAEGYRQEAFDNIYLNSGGNIGFGNLMGPFFDVGRSTDSASLGSFMRFTEGSRPTLLKHDLSCGVAFNINAVTSTIKTVAFPDSDGTLGLLVAAPATVNDAGKDGQWAKDTGFVYVYHVGNSKWGRAALSYAW